MRMVSSSLPQAPISYALDCLCYGRSDRDIVPLSRRGHGVMLLICHFRRGIADLVDSVEWARLRWLDVDQPEGDHFAMMVALMRLNQMVVSNLDRLLKGQGLARTAYLVLCTLMLAKSKTLTMTQLSRRLILHPTTISLVVDQLQARGLVVRKSHSGDRRTVLASMTDEGIEMLTAVNQSLGAQKYGLDGVDSRLAITLTEVIRQVRGDLGDA